MVPYDKQPSTPAALQGEGFEFELTDLEEARRVLDSESMSQFDVATVASPAQWKRVRRVTLPTDRALSGRAIDWLLRLPAGVRPEHLSSRFPRIAIIALIDDDPPRTLPRGKTSLRPSSASCGTVS